MPVLPVGVSLLLMLSAGRGWLNQQEGQILAIKPAFQLDIG